jgi:hypothetical protein
MSDDPSYECSVCVVCARLFLKGVPGEVGMPPSGYVQHSGQCPQKKNFFFRQFLLFLAYFSIFSGLLKIISFLGIWVLVSTEYLKKLYILYSEW